MRRATERSAPAWDYFLDLDDDIGLEAINCEPTEWDWVNDDLDRLHGCFVTTAIALSNGQPPGSTPLIFWPQSPTKSVTCLSSTQSTAVRISAVNGR